MWIQISTKNGVVIINSSTLERSGRLASAQLGCGLTRGLVEGEKRRLSPNTFTADHLAHPLRLWHSSLC